MLLLPRKRHAHDEGDGGSDDDEWRVGYAEDIDERRAELLRRLDSKTSGHAKLVNPWATPGVGLSRGPGQDGVPILEGERQHLARAKGVGAESVGGREHPGGGGAGGGAPLPGGAAVDVGAAGAPAGAHRAALVVAVGGGTSCAAATSPQPPLRDRRGNDRSCGGGALENRNSGGDGLPPRSSHSVILSGGSGGGGDGGGPVPGRMSRGGLGGLLPLPLPPTVPASVQKGKKAKFVIRQAGPSPSPVERGAAVHAAAERELVLTPAAAAAAAPAQVVDAPDGRRLEWALENAAAGAERGSKFDGGVTPAAGGEQGPRAGSVPAQGRLHVVAGSGGLAALLGGGPAPLPAVLAAKLPLSATPVSRRPPRRISAPSPLTALKTPSAHPHPTSSSLNDHTMSVPRTTAPAGTATASGSCAALPAVTGSGSRLSRGLSTTRSDIAGDPGAPSGVATTPRQSPQRVSTVPSSLRELLLPQPALAATAPSPRQELLAAAVCSGGPDIQGLRARDLGAPGTHGGDDGGLAPSNHGATQPHGAGPYGHPVSLHGQPEGEQLQPRQQRQSANPLEVMDQHSNRQREFLQGLGPLAPPSALGAVSRRGSCGGGGRGTAAAGSLQGQLQAVLSTLKLAIDREAESAASARPPPPVGSFLAEVRSRTREAHLMKTTCTVRQLYGVDAAVDGRGTAAGRVCTHSQVAVLPTAMTLEAATADLRVGQQVHVFMDSKRGSSGIVEPGDLVLILQPYSILRVGKLGARGQQEFLGQEPSAAGVAAPGGSCGSMAGSRGAELPGATCEGRDEGTTATASRLCNGEGGGSGVGVSDALSWQCRAVARQPVAVL